MSRKRVEVREMSYEGKDTCWRVCVYVRGGGGACVQGFVCV